MNRASVGRRFGAASVAAIGVSLVALVAAQCGAPASSNPHAASDAHSAHAPDRAAARAAWATVYEVLQHPRCANCHPAGDVPLQGDERRPHGQEVQRGPDGLGVVTMRCADCHQTTNLEGAHLPPGAPNWHLPRPDMPLVFEGRSSTELCRQLRDSAQNGGLTPAKLLTHVAHDPLVLWGWAPGAGRTPVPTTHDDFVRAMQTWIENGCDCPE